MVEPYELRGLAYHPYDPELPAVFSRAHNLLMASRPVPWQAVEHIGSTAVPNLDGKNILNILVAAEPGRLSEAVAALERLGFTEHPYKNEPPERPLRVAGLRHQNRLYDLHLHLTEAGSPDHQNALFFRDYLRAHPEAREEYAAIKRNAVRSGLDGLAYNKAKEPFIRKTLSTSGRAGSAG
ncbi:GrpB family protein [Patescibacteria group bacterium]|nr:GrpB family protein [Patescibacteria group bacterium]